MAGLVDNGKIVAEVTPRKMGQSKVVMLLLEIERYVCSQVPFFCRAVSREDSEVDAKAIWGDVCNAPVL